MNDYQRDNSIASLLQDPYIHSITQHYNRGAHLWILTKLGDVLDNMGLIHYDATKSMLRLMVETLEVVYMDIESYREIKKE